jgi:hypothetical protein
MTVVIKLFLLVVRADELNATLILIDLSSG